ncbi:hypothetical protein GIY23_21635 [Allosaccharopolyspora coralli]|uniref:Uncharacterized protein n=1 Tax=Allosaccharopolyspora coralli TaxID=2665642 RepID=A0A5Q3QCZ1_9PSEU|nr:hypothetical protein [Allosaccharopolyspora coralli]QGK71770.1 hypothetical protein GIY23_21635 [Allosaccharopolyspora coralli]
MGGPFGITVHGEITRGKGVGTLGHRVTSGRRSVVRVNPLAPSVQRSFDGVAMSCQTVRLFGEFVTGLAEF